MANTVHIEKVRIGRWYRDEIGRDYPVEHEWFVYSGDRLVRVCPSEGMAHEVAASL
jgi:hypothetical protein